MSGPSLAADLGSLSIHSGP